MPTPTSTGASGAEGKLHDEGGVYWYFDPAERVRFSTPRAGDFGDGGRNAFRGPSAWNVDLGLQKRFELGRGHELQLRADATNLTNTPSFGFPTATITSATFGRVRDAVISGSRKIQIAVGAPVARRPPHGSERAELAHSALALGAKAESHIGIGVRDAGAR